MFFMLKLQFKTNSSSILQQCTCKKVKTTYLKTTAAQKSESRNSFPSFVCNQTKSIVWYWYNLKCFCLNCDENWYELKWTKWPHKCWNLQMFLLKCQAHIKIVITIVSSILWWYCDENWYELKWNHVCFAVLQNCQHLYAWDS